MLERSTRDWHALTIEDTLLELGGVSASSGLSADDVVRQRARFGANQLAEAKRASFIVRVLRQFNNVLIIVLLISAIIAAAFEHYIDAGVIVAVVLLNAVIGFAQEGRAEQALLAIRKMVALRAVVLRDGGKQRNIEASELVPGDVVLLTSGDQVPADLRLVQVRLFVCFFFSQHTIINIFRFIIYMRTNQC